MNVIYILLKHRERKIRLTHKKSSCLPINIVFLRNEYDAICASHFMRNINIIYRYIITTEFSHSNLILRVFLLNYISKVKQKQTKRQQKSFAKCFALLSTLHYWVLTFNGSLPTMTHDISPWFNIYNYSGQWYKNHCSCGEKWVCSVDVSD